MKRITIAALLWVCSSAFAQSVVVLDERSFPISAGETQSTVVRPGHPQCAAGRVLVSDDGVRPPATSGIVVYRDLNEPATAMHESTFNVMPDKDNYTFGTNDHDLVTLPNGDVLYLSGAFSKTAVIPEPTWWKTAYRGNFGPGARTLLLVWRSTDCGKTFQYQANMKFDPAVMSDRSCALPQWPRTFRHDGTGSGKLVVPSAAFSTSGDEEWTWCHKCQQLVSTKAGQARICPDGGEHATAGAYELHQGMILGHPDDTGFKRCKHCGTLFDSEAAGSKCAARVAHAAGAKEYFLIHGASPVAGATQVEQGWRWCSKCQSLYLEGAAASVCPAGMLHDGAHSGNYQIPLKGSTSFAGEQGWRRCSKCQQVFRDTQGMPSVCPKGNVHTSIGVAYQLPVSAPAGLASQGGWRQCTKCGALHVTGPNNPSQCALVGSHDGAGSPDYHLPHEEGPGALTNLQTQWRSCAKCGSVYFSGNVAQTCAARQKGDEQPVYGMGGSDGQLVNVDQATGQIYLAFQCVGFTEAQALPNFELTNTPLNRTLVAVSSGASWSVLGVPKTRSWRMGLLPQGTNKLALSVGGVLIPAKNSIGKWAFDSTGIDVAKSQAGWDGFNTKQSPRNLIHTNIWNHTIIARTPGSKRVLMTVPDTFAGQGHGYRLFFVDPDSAAVTEAKVPILPASAKPDDFTLHMQAIDIGTGPVLLYWNDVSGSDVTIRGRFVTGLDQYTKDFVISRAGGKDRSFSLKQVTSAYWYGDYQTASGYKVEGVIGRSHYYPLWAEPDKTVHYGHVVYNPLGLVPASLSDMVTIKGMAKIARRVPVASIKVDEESEEYEERSRVWPELRPNP